MKGLYESFGFLFAKAVDKIESNVTPFVDSFGINNKEAGLLFLLLNDDGIVQKEAGEIQKIDRTTMVKLVDHLESLDFVERVKDQNDRRMYKLYLTEKGKKIAEDILQEVNKIQKLALGNLTDEEYETLRKLLIKIL